MWYILYIFKSFLKRSLHKYYLFHQCLSYNIFSKGKAKSQIAKAIFNSINIIKIRIFEYCTT